nr:MAG TPA: hypothetical protein [Caudoviricetes sp.]
MGLLRFLNLKPHVTHHHGHKCVLRFINKN